MIVLGEGHQCSHKAQDPYDKLDADTLHQRKNCIALEKTRSALLCICGSVTTPLRPQLRLEVRVVLTILHGAISASLPGEREKSRIRVAPTLSHGVLHSSSKSREIKRHFRRRSSWTFRPGFPSVSLAQAQS